MVKKSDRKRSNIWLIISVGVTLISVSFNFYLNNIIVEQQNTFTAKTVISQQTTISNLHANNSALNGKVGELEKSNASLMGQLKEVQAQRDRLQNLANNMWLNVGGTAKTKTFGTTATWVYFILDGTRHGARISGDMYSISLLNNRTYIVQIEFISGGIGGQICNAGTFGPNGSMLNYQRVWEC